MARLLSLACGGILTQMPEARREIARAPGALSTFRDVTRIQWYAFFAAFLGWLLDGFDFSILSFLLIDIEHSFTVDKALAGALGTVTLLFRLVGGLSAGTAADRFGRKTPLILSILWLSLFSLLSGFSTSYAILFVFRALFGIGMGGVWAAGMPLALEHWPDHLRGVASGLLAGGFYWGYMLAAVVFELLYPLVNVPSGPGWRMFFWLGAAPALLALWIMPRVKESPVWLARRGQLNESNQRDELSILRIFRRDLVATTLQTSLLIGVFMMSYYSITFWYPTFLREARLPTIRYLVALNFGAIVGAALWGRVSETRVGRRGAATLAALIGVLVIPIFVGPHSPTALSLGALLMGASGMGLYGIVPSYLTERFPTAVRSVGPGFAYHAGAALGSVTPAFIGALQDRGVRLPGAMAGCMLVSGVLVAGMIWLGPETRGRSFTPSA
jgi:SHS family lactate transporter-like MFS transporter